MNAGRGRSGAFIAALLVCAAVALLPPFRPYVRAAAVRLGLLSTPRPLAAGQPLGTIALQTLDGAPVRLQQRRGHPLIINVFATWCGPCREETPYLSRLAGEFTRRGIDVVGVDQAEPPGAVERFTAAYNLRYPIYIDGDSQTRTTLNARVIPTTIFVDGNNVVRNVHVGPLSPGDLR